MFPACVAFPVSEGLGAPKVKFAHVAWSIALAAGILFAPLGFAFAY
jgi:hypothetical protein